MSRHLSQPFGTGAFDGQHGMSFAISSAIADAAISCDMATIAPANGDSAITGRDNGAKTRPAIIKIAKSRRMFIWRFIAPNSHMCDKLESLSR